MGLEQIRAGMAWHYKEYQHEQPTQERLVYAQEEENAKASRVGLWKERRAGAAVGMAKRRPRRKVDAALHATLAGV